MGQGSLAFSQSYTRLPKETDSDGNTWPSPKSITSPPAANATHKKMGRHSSFSRSSCTRNSTGGCLFKLNIIEYSLQAGDLLGLGSCWEPRT